MINILIMLLFLSGASFILSHLMDIHKTPYSEIHFHIQSEGIKTLCSKTIVPCKSQADCSLCQETGMSCYKGKCIHPRARLPCNRKHGGLEVLTMNQLNELQFQCVCLYPHFFTGDSCDTKNPHVCQNGYLNIDLSHELPSLANCDCPPDQVVKRIQRHFHHAYPICVPKTAAWIDTYA